MVVFVECYCIVHNGLGFEGHPETSLFSFDALVKERHGVGLTVFSDKLGIESTLVAKLAYSYKLNLGPGTLGIGIELGMLSKGFETGFVAIDDYTKDPSIPNAKTSVATFDAGFGVYYSIANKMYVGISSLHLPASTLSQASNGGVAGDKGALNYESARHYYIQAGYDWDIKQDQKLVLKPSVFAKTDASSTQLDINALLLYNNLVWGGVSYRLEDAVAILAGVNIPQVSGLKIGLAYDLTLSALSDHSNGSLEFLVKYCTVIEKPIKREVYHSVRFL